MPVIIGEFGTGPYGTGTYGGLGGAGFRLLSAEAANPYTVLLTFNDNIDPAYAPTLDPTNYLVPGLTVTRVVPNPSNPSALYLYTTVQSYQLYTATVGNLLSLSGGTLETQYRSASFTGWSTEPCFTAVAVGPRRVRLIFVRPMLLNATLLNPANYAVQDVGGVYNPVLNVQAEQPVTPTSVVLTLQDDLPTTRWHRVDVSVAVTTQTGLSLIPRHTTFQWVNPDRTVHVGLDKFTGEVTGGLFGNPLGQVFFSPALEAPLANSVIEIDEVSVCTQAYDSYELPQPIDPNPLYTWSAFGPKPPLNQSGVVLWASFPRLVDARTIVSDLRADTVAAPVDGPATATFQQPWDPAYVSLLNNDHWQLTPPSSVGSVMFQTASNLAPIPPGPTVTVVLQP